MGPNREEWGLSAREPIRRFAKPARDTALCLWDPADLQSMYRYLRRRRMEIYLCGFAIDPETLRIHLAQIPAPEAEMLHAGVL